MIAWNMVGVCVWKEGRTLTCEPSIAWSGGGGGVLLRFLTIASFVGWWVGVLSYDTRQAGVWLLRLLHDAPAVAGAAAVLDLARFA